MKQQLTVVPEVPEPACELHDTVDAMHPSDHLRYPAKVVQIHWLPEEEVYRYKVCFEGDTEEVWLTQGDEVEPRLQTGDECTATLYPPAGGASPILVGTHYLELRRLKAEVASVTKTGYWIKFVGHTIPLQETAASDVWRMDTEKVNEFGIEELTLNSPLNSDIGRHTMRRSRNLFASSENMLATSLQKNEWAQVYEGMVVCVYIKSLEQYFQSS